MSILAEFSDERRQSEGYVQLEAVALFDLGDEKLKKLDYFA